MADNLLRLDLSRFTSRDVGKIDRLGDKMRLLHRWFRRERRDDAGGEAFAIYSGDRGKRRYASYRIVRRADGGYGLLDGDRGTELADGRTIDEVIDALPDSFYYSKQ